jgi:two-component system, chemotaxis family, chemotaxis protein CheY
MSNINDYKILVCDDRKLMRDLLHGILRRLGHTNIVDSESGSKAIYMYKTDRPDIVFLDIEFPGSVSGLDVLKELVAYDPTCFVVMVSAHGTFRNVKEAMDMGAKGFIVKPYSGGKVRDMIAKYEKEHLPALSMQG